MVSLPSYCPPKWLIGGHLQTIWPARIIKFPSPKYTREYLPTPDGQTQLACDYVFADRPNAPLIMMFHGLEGSSQSHYAKALMSYAKEKGFNGVIVHFRGCGGVPLKGSKAYHGGDSEEVAWILHALKQRFGKVFATGVSLGGNMLAKYLGEYRERVDCDGAVVISAPLDMVAASVPLSKGLGKNLYTMDFLRTLKPKAYQFWLEHPDRFDWDAVKKAKTFAEFDSYFTAPIHGFKDAMDYWTQSSAKPLLKNIQVPTLIINAQNDPFIPADSLPNEKEVSVKVSLLQPKDGGHVGFASGAFPGDINWLPKTILSFLTGTC